MGKLTKEVFNESCCDGGRSLADTRELAERHAQEHAESINVPQHKMGVCFCQVCLPTPMTTPNAALPLKDAMDSASAVSASGTASICGSAETRVVDPLTGGEKGSKLQRYDLIPPEAIRALAEHYGRGARKYADRNWEKGYKWGLSYAALMRHLEAWRQGEDNDAETGSNHLVAVIWHAVALYIFQLRGLGTDDLRVV